MYTIEIRSLLMHFCIEILMTIFCIVNVSFGICAAVAVYYYIYFVCLYRMSLLLLTGCIPEVCKSFIQKVISHGY